MLTAGGGSAVLGYGSKFREHPGAKRERHQNLLAVWILNHLASPILTQRNVYHQFGSENVGHFERLIHGCVAQDGQQCITFRVSIPCRPRDVKHRPCVFFCKSLVVGVGVAGWLEGSEISN